MCKMRSQDENSSAILAKKQCNNINEYTRCTSETICKTSEENGS